MDCAWIDYIVFPPLTMGQTKTIDTEGLNFKIFPNPTMGIFNLTFNDSKKHTVQVFDINGKIVSSLTDQSVKTNLNLKEYSAGTYTVRVMPEGITYQIVKQ
jgi:hypothetical protein